MSGGQISTAACRGRGKLVCGFHRGGAEEGKEIIIIIKKNQIENGQLGLLQTACASRYLTVVSVRRFPRWLGEAIETASRSVFFLLAACLID